MTLACTAPVLVPFAGGPRAALLAVLVGAFFLGDAGSAVANIHVASLRQLLAQPGLLGRLTAAHRLISWGALPVGALLGGGLTQAVGARPTLAVAAGGFLAALGWVVVSPLPRTAPTAG